MKPPTIEQIMKQGGWLRTTRSNAGKVYVEYIKDGWLIDEGDIVKEHD